MDPHRVLIILPSSGRDFVPLTSMSSSDSGSSSDTESEASVGSFVFDDHLEDLEGMGESGGSDSESEPDTGTGMRMSTALPRIPSPFPPTASRPAEKPKTKDTKGDQVKKVRFDLTEVGYSFY